MRVFLSLTAAAAALTCAAGQAHAEHWVVANVSGGAIAFDEHSLNADIRTGMVAINTVTYYSTPRDAGGQPANFTAERLIFECRGNRYRWERAAAIDMNGQVLAEVPNSDWIQMDQSLGARALYRRIACTTERPPIAGDAATLEALFAEIPALAAGQPRAASAPAPAPTPTPTPEPAPPVVEATPFDADAIQSILDADPEPPLEPRLRGSSD